MAVNIGPKIGIDGEAEYRKQINNIIQQAKTLDAQMREVASGFDDAAGSQDKAAESAKLLNDRVEVQRQRVKALSDMLQKSTDKLGATDTTTLKWAQSLSEAKTDLNRLTKEMDTSQAGTTSLGDVVENITNKFGVSLPSGIKSSLDGFTLLGSKLTATIGIAAAVVTAIVKIEEALIDITQEQAEYAKQVQANAQIVGMSAEEYQELDYVLKTVGYSAEEAQGDLSMLAEKAMDAAAGTGEGAELFDKLGVSVTDTSGKLKSQAEIFDLTVEALRSMGDETERNAIASALLGTTGEKLIPILNEESGAIDELKERAKELGAVMSDETLASLNNLNEKSLEFDASLQGLKNVIAEEMAPALTTLMEAGTEAIVALQSALEESGVVEIFGALLEVVSALGPLFESLFSLLGSSAKDNISGLVYLLKALADVLTVITSAIAALIEGVKQLLSLITSGEADFENFLRYIGNITSIFGGGGSAVSYLSGSIGRNAAGTNYWRGGLTWVGEQGPELVSLPRGTAIYNNAQSMAMTQGHTNITFTMNEHWFRKVSELLKQADSASQQRRQGVKGFVR